MYMWTINTCLVNFGCVLATYCAWVQIVLYDYRYEVDWPTLKCLNLLEFNWTTGWTKSPIILKFHIANYFVGTWAFIEHGEIKGCVTRKELAFWYGTVQINSIFEKMLWWVVGSVKLNLFRLKTAREMVSHLVMHLALILLYFIL